MGIPCSPSVKDIPKTPDLAIICAAAGQVPGPRAGVRRGRHPRASSSSRPASRKRGPRGRPSRTRSGEASAASSGMRIVGPNCLGIIVPGHQLNASFAPAMPQKGHIAFISQSGRLVHLGPRLGPRGEDRLLLFRLDRQHARRRLRRPDRLFRRGRGDQVHHPLRRIDRPGPEVHDRRPGLRPDQAHRRLQGRPLPGVGRRSPLPTPARWPARTRSTTPPSSGPAWPASSTSARSSTSPSSSAGTRSRREPASAIVTNAGGPGVMATDALIAAGGVLARAVRRDAWPSSTTACRPCGPDGNPVDVLGDAKSKLVAKAVGTVLQDPASTPSWSSSRPRP